MKSVDYLYDILRKHEGAICTSYFVGGKRYAIGAVPPSTANKDWSWVLCAVRGMNKFAVTFPFPTQEEAWVDFLGREHPEFLAKWEAAESGK